jgi:hypothetical protein
MKNLAGNEECDLIISEELRRCKIPAVQVEKSVGEVPYSLIGTLGPIRFERAWYYWVVEGPVPLDVAIQLYEDPVGRTDIRVAGHCGCPPPESWAQWYMSTGEIVLSLKEKTQIEGFPIIAKDIGPVVFSDDPKSLGASAFVESYHIDTEIGLRVFADSIRRLV